MMKDSEKLEVLESEVKQLQYRLQLLNYSNFIFAAGLKHHYLAPPAALGCLVHYYWAEEIDSGLLSAQTWCQESLSSARAFFSNLLTYNTQETIEENDASNLL